MTHDLRLNIICFDVPFPADYGGAMEEFYKIKALHLNGIKIHLHCFVYGDRKEQQELEKYCEKIYYYKRERSIIDMFSNIPFIVKSRMNKDLLNNLANNTFPILFDGTHTIGFLNHPLLMKRKKLVRLHNIEWIYYNILFHAAIKLKEKLFYFSEYKKLRKFDVHLKNADALLCLSEVDVAYYKEKFPEVKCELIPVFHENDTIESKTGIGNYILYHGNLSVLDNYMAVIDVLNAALKHCKHQIIIAGKNPDKLLIEVISAKSNVKLIANPDKDEMKDLVANAQICLAIANNPSGIKLKVINSIFHGRYIFSNEAAFKGTGLEECIISLDEKNVVEIIDNYMQKEFTATEIEKRKKCISTMYDNSLNALKIKEIVNSISDN